MNRIVRVCPFPTRLQHNPYLDELYDHIHALRDPRLLLVRPRRTSLGLLELMSGRGSRICHLHFFDQLVQRPSEAETRIRRKAFLGLLALVRACGVHLVWTAHNLEPHEMHHGKLAWETYAAVLRSADAVIVHSRAARLAILDRYGEPRRIEVIPHGNWARLAGTPPPKPVCRQHLGWPQDVPILLALGSLLPYKGFEDLIDAFAGLAPAAARQARLVIAGPATDRTFLEALGNRCARVAGVRLAAGYVADRELPMVVTAADCVVLPYRKILTSGMLFWPLQLAVPVIVPAFAPMSEMLTDNVSAFLYEPGNIDALRSALERVLRHPDPAAVGRAGKAAASGSDWGQSAKRTSNLYLEVAGIG
jgi:glycosyltransferase involved in cell wall biosynthesis